MYLLVVTESSVAIAKNRTNSTSPESSFIIHMSILTNRLIYELCILWTFFQSCAWQSFPQYLAIRHFEHFFKFSTAAKQFQHNLLHFLARLSISTPYFSLMNFRISVSYIIDPVSFSFRKAIASIYTEICSAFSSLP